jgi:hypothetical protein
LKGVEKMLVYISEFEMRYYDGGNWAVVSKNYFDGATQLRIKESEIEEELSGNRLKIKKEEQ